jgi:hypothetical protein
MIGEREGEYTKYIMTLVRREECKSAVCSGKWNCNDSWMRHIHWNHVEQLFRDGRLGAWRIK